MRPSTTGSILAVALVVLLGFWSVGCSKTPIDSGIEGTVTIGPLQPVSRPGEPDSEPYQAEIAVKAAGSGSLIETFVSAVDGTFRVALAPGLYVLEPKPGDPLPIAPSQNVTVEAGRFTKVTIQYDSGIR